MSSIKQSLSYEDKIIKEIESLPDAPKVKLFSDFEDDLIRKYYPTKGANGLAKVLNKTANQIKSRAQHLNVKRII